MEEKFEFTKSQLAQAFAKWLAEVNETPDNFGENTTDGVSEAETLIGYLKQV